MSLLEKLKLVTEIIETSAKCICQITLDNGDLLELPATIIILDDSLIWQVDIFDAVRMVKAIVLYKGKTVFEIKKTNYFLNGDSFQIVWSLK